MSSQRDLFDLAAADAANARIAAQAELAENLANEIMTNPMGFDPKRLGSLGSKGILILLAAVRQHDVRETVARRYMAPDHTDAGAKDTSWRHLRKPEPNHWLRSAAAGTGCGLIIIALGLSVAMFS